ncbi:MAG: lipid II:glycine glycyltransferase FemX [Chloroflexota bacterium]
MTLGVRSATPADRDDWERLTQRCGSFLQSWRWGELREKQGWQCHRLVAEEDGRLTGAMQVLQRRFKPLGSMLYVPRGPAVAEGAALEPLLAALRPLVRRQRAWFARVEPDLPAGPEQEALLGRFGLQRATFTVQLPHTVIVDLTPAPEQILAGFKATWRRYVRHAPQRGVRVREGTAEDLATFYALERETATRQGILGRPLEYYRQFYAQFAGAGAHVWLAELDGEPLSAILTLEFGAAATYLYGGSTRRHSDSHPNYLLQWTAMLHARAAGCRRYDLWGTGAPGDTAGHEAGLTIFKSGFGPVYSLVGAWDLPASPWYGAWRQAEGWRQARLRERAKGAGRTKGKEVTVGVQSGQALKVRDVTPAPAEQWDAWLAASPGGGHWMQTHAWGEFKRTRNWEPLRVLLEENGAIVGAGQIGLHRLPLLGTLAYCAKGPWLDWTNAAHVEAFFGGVGKLLRARRVFVLKIEPEALESNEPLKAQFQRLGFRKFRWDPQFKTTMVVDLGGAEEHALARMSQTARRYIRAAQRDGITVVEDNAPAAQEAFYAMMRITSKRGGFFLRPRWYMRAYWQHIIDAGYGRFLFARKDGNDEVAMFLTNFGSKVYYKDGASLNEGRQSHAMYALQWAAMRWGKAHGAGYYDMVAIPPPDQLENREHEMWGLYEFKRKFGGEVRDFLGAYDLPYARRIAFLWDRVLEPVYYRAYMKVLRNVYY